MKFYSHFLYFAFDFDKNSVHNVSTEVYIVPVVLGLHSASSFVMTGTVSCFP